MGVQKGGLTRVEALHPEGQTGLGDGDEFQSDVELAPPEVTQPSGSTQLCDLNPHPTHTKDKEEQLTTLYSCETLKRREEKRREEKRREEKRREKKRPSDNL